MNTDSPVSPMPMGGSAPVKAGHSFWPPPRALVLSLVFLGVLWLLVFNQLRLEWAVNVIYSYGWAVPLLAVYLFWERWRSRPPLNAPVHRWPAFVLTVLLVLAILPVRVIQESNPDWVKINWILTGIGMGVSFAAIYAIGGLRALWHFGFPVLFVFTALAWPVWLEEYFVQSLMRSNASVSAEVLTMLGLPAVARGNLIEVGNTWLNVEEACSGIRSLQTAFMTSLFFGEFYRCGLLGRVTLVVSSFVLAFLLNVGRTLVLAYGAASQGPETVDRWHDTVGNIVMVACLGGLWLLAEGISRFSGRAPAEASPEARRVPVRAPFPAWLAVGGIVWVFAAEGMTEAWYRFHERDNSQPADWTIAWPETAPEFVRSDFPERTFAIMKYSEGDTASWRGGDGYHWTSYYMRWEPGRVSKFLAGAHYPTVCLPATGLQLVSELEDRHMTVNGVTFPFKTYLFSRGNRDVYVFHAVMEDVPEAEAGRIVYRQAKSSERLSAVLRGERNLGQRVLGIAVTGPVRPKDALTALEDTLQSIVDGPDGAGQVVQQSAHSDRS